MVHSSRVTKKWIFAYVKTKVQISCAVTDQLISAFVFATPLLSKSEISSLQPASVLVQVGLFWTCSETTLVFFMTRLIYLLLTMIKLYHKKWTEGYPVIFESVFSPESLSAGQNEGENSLKCCRKCMLG